MADKKKMGRPTKIELGDLQAIVRGYYITCGGEDPAVMSAHNIYAQLERYAAEHGLRGNNSAVLKASDFRRPEIKGYIQKLADQAKQRDVPLAMEPVYERMDIQHCLGQSVKRQKEILTDRENYYESLYKRANLAIAQYADLAERVKQLQERIARLQEENRNLQEEIGRSSAECANLRKDNADYRRYIRKYVDPERARNYLIEMRKDGPQTETLIDMVQQDVTIQPDKETAPEDTTDQWGAIYDLFRDE